MIYPEKSSITTRVKEYLFEKVTNTVLDHPRFEVPAPESMRCECLNIHLGPFKEIILGGEFSKGFNIFNAAETFISLYQSCLSQYCTISKRAYQEWVIQKVSNVSLLKHGSNTAA